MGKAARWGLGRSCRQGLAAVAWMAAAHPAGALATPVLPQAEEALSVAVRAADWQLANRDRHLTGQRTFDIARSPRDWKQATFWVALTDLAGRVPRFRAPVLATGRAERWQLYRRPFHADDQLIGQAWIWASRNGGGDAALGPTRRYVAHVLANRPSTSLTFDPDRKQGDGTVACTVRWCWCDALFMAPPTLLRLAAVTGDKHIAEFVHAEFRATTELLYDPAERLYYRDSRFIGRRDAQSRKIFWSRGNGWVMAGLARMIDALPADDPQRGTYIALFRDMAGRVAQLQKADGSWAPSLLDDGPSPPESSGTGFFTYAFAWGIGAGVLPRDRFAPVAARGWASIRRAVRPDGMVGWVQQVGDQPGEVRADQTQFYGTGAVILAGVALHDLARGGAR